MGVRRLFGYIRPLEAQLRVCELEEYRAVYCGLCRTLGKRFGPFARAALSFDFVFITMLALSLKESEPKFSKHACPFFPVRKRPHLEICEEAELACDELLLLLRESCSDKLADESFIRSLPWRVISPAVKLSARSAVIGRPEVDILCREMTASQAIVEADTDAAVDAACDPTATAMSKLLSMLSDDDNESRVLSRLGYMLGRFIYLCDAVDDLEKDREKGAFNPFISRDDKEYQRNVLQMTIAEACAAYDLLSPRYFKGILDNIIFLGLSNTAERLLKGEDIHEKSI